MSSLPQTLLRAIARHPVFGKVLLGCGVVASAWWVSVDVVASLRYPGYSYTDQIISELSAEGAPTRTFWLAANAIPYAMLMSAFGVGVWAVAGRTRAGRTTGVLIVGYAITGLGGWLFPMAMRGDGGTLRNAMHVPAGLVNILFFLLIMGFGATLFGKPFRYYTYLTIATLVVFGVLTGLQSGKMVEDQSTPWIGSEERISVYATMLWFAVLAVGLLREQGVSIRGWGSLTRISRKAQKLPQ